MMTRMATTSSTLLSLLIIAATSTLKASGELLKCADEIKCEDRPTGSCSSCVAPASYSSGFRCAVPKAVLGLPSLLDSPYCHYCESNGKCLSHKDVDATTCPDMNFMKFEEECTGPPGDSGLTNVDSDIYSNGFLANWMEKVMEVSDGTLTLYDLSIVGSHDATSYDLDTVYSTAAPAAATESVEQGAAAAALIVDKFRERAMSFARRAAETQFLTMSQQLDSGVRFIDLRLNFETDLKEWYSLHTLRSNQNIYVYLEEIKDWMVQHPKEVVVIWLSRQGSTDDMGTDQFPNASLERKAEFWSKYTQIFDGMLVDVTMDPPHSTPINDIAGKVVTFASDYQELTEGSVYALDAAVSLKNTLGKGIIGSVESIDTSAIEYTYEFEQDEFSMYDTLKAANPDTYHLLSMSSSVTADWAGFAPLIELNPISSDKASNLESCAALFNAFPDFKEDWCPMSLMDINLITNYYKQITIEQARTNETWDFPQAIYIDAIDVNGTIRTSTHLPWNQQRSTFFGDDIKRYAVVWAFVERNLRVACGSTNTDKCTEYLQIAENGMNDNPLRRWNDTDFLRVTQWPELHSNDIVLTRKEENDNNETEMEEETPLSGAICWMGGMGHGWSLLGLASAWLLVQHFL